MICKSHGHTGGNGDGGGGGGGVPDRNTRGRWVNVCTTSRVGAARDVTARKRTQALSHEHVRLEIFVRCKIGREGKIRMLVIRAG